MNALKVEYFLKNTFFDKIFAEIFETKTIESMNKLFDKKSIKWSVN